MEKDFSNYNTAKNILNNLNNDSIKEPINQLLNNIEFLNIFIRRKI